MTWKDAITLGSNRLVSAGIFEGLINAEYLAAHVLGIWKRSDLRKYYDVVLRDDEQIRYEDLLKRRCMSEPLQHILGETEFFGLRLLATSEALIPRPDTEILVEELIKDGSSHSGEIHILDIGTGSGAIALALASKLPKAKIIGIDISPDAISLADRNKDRLGIGNVSFEIADLFADDMLRKLRNSFDYLVSNPPYISIEEFTTLEAEVRDFDPRIALTDEGDGLRFYRRIAEIAPNLLKPGGEVLVEIGYGASQDVEEIFTAVGFKVIGKIKDLQGIIRVIKAQIPN
ncbi:MAG: peptide chain release factor N(5)-glutamine methyltransferase [Bacteroidota bacterium]|nr:peptide chain release factor N(5)-glutamine methyltransferase [Bacteroidota bacterium]MDP4231056.1 peptide chain release factor N(5)-glutamine methyltransferase [Bacteroidota bacterium]MDP4234854.1 peptide chain release factor N(5)-glutamine methyltransferase [Bacteroidota bacterium]